MITYTIAKREDGAVVDEAHEASWGFRALTDFAVVKSVKFHECNADWGTAVVVLSKRVGDKIAFIGYSYSYTTDSWTYLSPDEIRRHVVEMDIKDVA